MHARIAGTAILFSLLLNATAAMAGQPVPGIYSNELARCVGALRDQLQDVETRRLRYTVTELETRGAWYEFAIHAEVFNTEDGDAVRTRDSRCRAHRWDSATQLIG